MAVLAALAIASVIGAQALAARGERAIGPDPVVSRWPSWPFPTSCGGTPFDPVAAFGGQTGSERGSRPSERALRGFIKRQPWVRDYVPARDWRLLYETETEAEFASGRLTPTGPSVMSFERVGGRWKWSGLSSLCEPTSVIGWIEAVTWSLARERPLPKPGARRIWIELGPGACSGGRSQNARARRPVVWQVDRKLIVAMTLRPLPPGGYTCEGLIEPPMAIRLPPSTGGLRLFDGATYPPTDAVRQWRKEARPARAGQSPSSRSTRLLQ